MSNIKTAMGNSTVPYLEAEIAALKEEIERLKKLYKGWGYADAPCPKHSRPSLLKVDCAVCRTEAAIARADAAEADLKEARKDTGRLDWIDRNMDCDLSGPGLHLDGVEVEDYETLRQAIDRAILDRAEPEKGGS